MLVRGRAIQYLCRAARRRQNRAHGCVCNRLPAASGESFLRTAQAARQNRYHDAREEADGSSPRSKHDGKFQTPGHDRANGTAEMTAFGGRGGAGAGCGYLEQSEGSPVVSRLMWEQPRPRLSLAKFGSGWAAISKT